MVAAKQIPYNLKRWLSANTLAGQSDIEMTVQFAGWTGNPNSLEMRTNRGDDTTSADNFGRRALHLAVWNMHAEAVTLLLSDPCVSIESRDPYKANYCFTFGKSEQ
jgi:hypothetical protein